MEEKKNIIIDITKGKIDFSKKIEQINSNPENYICIIKSNRQRDIEEVLRKLNHNVHVVLDGISEKNYNKIQPFALNKINEVNFDNTATERYKISCENVLYKFTENYIPIDEINKNPDDYEIYVSGFDVEGDIKRLMHLNNSVPLTIDIRKSEYDKIPPIYLSERNYKVNIIDNNNIVELYTAKVDFTKKEDINLEEIILKLNSQPKMSEVRIKANNALEIEKIINQIDDNVSIILEEVTKYIFDELSADSLKGKKYYINFSKNDKYVENINIGDIKQKFSEMQNLYYPLKVLSKNNVTDFSQILYILQMKEGREIGLDPELLEQYKQEFNELEVQMKDYKLKLYQLRKENSEDTHSIKEIDEIRKNLKELYGSYDITISSKYIYSNNNGTCYTVNELKNVENYDDVFRRKHIKMLINSMAEMSLEMAEKLKSEGFTCEIFIHSYDTGKFQDGVYSLDEYIEMSKKMGELIGDIDINLPEDKRFVKIYERVIKYLEYDESAAYPKNKEEEEYAEKNIEDCRNLRNALLQGKCVCAGFAEVLRNACLIKGIECENARGPIDKIKSKDYYIRKNEHFFYEDNKNKIVRSYHAWNKVKLNGIWYNCDPTWDKSYIEKGECPRYAFLSDKTYKQDGRATVEDLRHPCMNDMPLKEKDKLFENLQPSQNLKKNNQLIKFEKKLDINGNLLPVKQRDFSFNKILGKLKNIVKTLKEKIDETYNKSNEEENNTPKLLKSTTNSNKRKSWELLKKQKDEVNIKINELKNKENQISNFEKEKNNNDELEK